MGTVKTRFMLIRAKHFEVTTETVRLNRTPVTRVSVMADGKHIKAGDLPGFRNSDDTIAELVEQALVRKKLLLPDSSVDVNIPKVGRPRKPKVPTPVPTPVPTSVPTPAPTYGPTPTSKLAASTLDSIGNLLETFTDVGPATLGPERGFIFNEVLALTMDNLDRLTLMLRSVPPGS